MVAGVKLLGGSVSTSHAFTKRIMKAKTDKTTDAISSILNLSDPHIIYTLLRNCSGMVKLTYLCRITHPEAMGDLSSTVEQELRKVLDHISFGRASPSTLSDFSFALAGLPARYGGIGITQPAHTILVAYLQASGKVEALCRSILGDCNYEGFDLASLQCEDVNPLILQFNQVIFGEDTQSYLTRQLIRGMSMKELLDLLYEKSYVTSSTSILYGIIMITKRMHWLLNGEWSYQRVTLLLMLSPLTSLPLESRRRASRRQTFLSVILCIG